jgi:D-tyrosyl-tRNA(Tyr) deacylase
VSIDGTERSRIGKGFVILLGIRKGDTREAAKSLAERCASLRIFSDAEGKMNLSLREIQGSALVVSQFTLYADTRKGNRPGFSEACPPDQAEPLYEEFLKELARLLGPENVQTGVFRAMMEVGLVNDGPVTIMLEDRPTGDHGLTNNGGS